MRHTKFFTSTHHLNENGVSLYVDGVRLDRINALPADIRMHVERCEECKLQIMEVADMMKDMPLNRSFKHPFFDMVLSSTDRYSTLYRFAAVFILAAFAGAIYFSLPLKNEKQHVTIPEQINQPDTSLIHQEPVITSSSIELYAANFEPSPNLDDLVSSEFRSASIEVLSPGIGALVHSPVTFHWKQFDKPVKIKILSNKEITLLTSIVQNNSFVTSRAFVPGLYYWKLEANNELLFVGKFFVR